MFAGRRESLTILLNLLSLVRLPSRSALGLTFDNRLTVVTNDCYTRVSIGSKLPDADTWSRVEVTSISECEEQCSRSGSSCNAFTFGVGAKGNGSCAISARIPTGQDLVGHPDYDVYVKRPQGSSRCVSDRFYEDLNLESVVNTGKKNRTRPTTGKFRDTSLRTWDILRNKKKGSNEGSPLFKFAYHESDTFDGKKWDWPEPNFRTTVTPLPGQLVFEKFRAPFENGEIQFRTFPKNTHVGSQGVVTNFQSFGNKAPLDASELAVCYRKLQPGKKTTDLHVGRIIKCDNIRDCRRACDYENDFVCEGFNYRRSGGGPGGRCELTPTPYPRMDLHRDFVPDSRCDYYERNRDCQPETGWRDLPRIRPSASIPSWWNDNRPSYFPPIRGDEPHRPFYNENQPPRDRFPTYDDPHRRYPDKIPNTFSTPFQTYLFSNRRVDDVGYHRNNADRRNLPKDNWSPNDQPVYGDSYGYQRNGINGNYDLPGSSLNDGGRFPPTHQNEDFYGTRIYNYGGAFGYGDNNIPTAKDSFYGDSDRGGEKWSNEKCSIRASTGTRLASAVLRKSCLASDLDQCEAFCTNEKSFRCASFTYRYNVLPTNPTDNCLLSDLPYQDLNLYTDLVPDRDYDVYSVIEDSKACYLKISSDRDPSDECFARVRSGFGLPSDVAKKSVLADDLGECQVACTMSREFPCRTFAFRYSPEHRGDVRSRPSVNCFLSDWPSREINPANMPDMDGAELYERASFSRGCEPYPLPTVGNGLSTRSDDACYTGYHRPCRLTPHSVILSTRVDNESECRRKCSTMRKIDPVPCMSLSYKIATSGTESNCYLSDVSIRDLRPSLDYTYDDGHVLYAWKDLDPQCSLPAKYPVYGEDPAYGQFMQYGPTRDEDTGLSFPSPPRYPNTPDLHDPPFRDGIADNGRPENEGNPSNGPPYVTGGFEREFGFFYPREMSTFRRYTVNGQPCRNGTYCQRNDVAGFWSCEVEDELGGHGNWDYCCEPKHRCGFSQGYHYPWCYVGTNEDQWRPCSETYHPYYLPSERSDNQPSSRHSTRHWPIIYLHGTPPPNCTVWDPSRGRKRNSVIS